MIGVIDTSGLIRLFIPDGPIPEGSEGFLKEVESGNSAAIAPGLHLGGICKCAGQKKRIE